MYSRMSSTSNSTFQLDSGATSSPHEHDGIAGSHVGSSSINVTQLLQLLQQLTPDQLNELYKQLNIEQEVM